jgi:hypothetical protein
MGNTIHIPKRNKTNDYFTSLDDEKIIDLKNNYKLIEVDYLDPILVRSKMFNKSFTREYEKRLY